MPEILQQIHAGIFPAAKFHQKAFQFVKLIHQDLFFFVSCRPGCKNHQHVQVRKMEESSPM